MQDSMVYKRSSLTASSRWSLAFADILQGIMSWHIWCLLSWQDIRIRYRRSTIGPFWITLSMAIMVYSMGFLYGKLFGLSLEDYFPFVAAGLLTWSFISITVIDATNGFMESAPFMKQVRLPASIYILRVVCRNLIIFFHNLAAVIPILIYFHTPFGWNIAFLFVGLFILTACSFVYGMIFAMLGARFRDIQQIINSVVQVVFLLTPVIWNPAMLPGRFAFAVNLNPVAQMIALVREPLTGSIPSLYTIVVSIGIFALGFVVMMFLLYRSRHRIVFWV